MNYLLLSLSKITLIKVKKKKKKKKKQKIKILKDRLKMGCTASQEKTVDVNYAIMKNPPPPAANTAN